MKVQVQVNRAYRFMATRFSAADEGRLVVGAGVTLVLVQLAFRAWILYPSWFFLDDYNLLHDARFSPLDLRYLFSPYNGHLMPGGRLLVALVAESGSVDWPLAASLTLGTQALASFAALWMLVTLFGARRGALVPLAVYLSSAVTVPALVWWAAALNLVPVQATFFLAVGAWVRYLRAPGPRWLATTLAAVLGGLVFDVKGVLVVPVLAFVALAYFASGTVRHRLLATLRRRWPPILLGAAMLGGYAAYYLTQVPQITERAPLSVVPSFADSMLGKALTSGVLGGPWRWNDLAPPTAYADPPDWTVHLSWVVLTLVVLHAALRRTRTLRAWALSLGYALVLLLLLVNSRGVTFGPVLGLEYRYLADAAGVVALSLGLAYLPLTGATESSGLRDVPLLTMELPTAAVAALTAAVVAGGTVSSARYAGYWHHQNASDAYVHTLSSDLRAHGAVDLYDQPVPDSVISQLAAPNNTVRRLTSLLSTRVSFPASSSRLAVVGADGGIRAAQIKPGVTSLPGPDPGCGWRVPPAGRNIPLAGRAFDYVWWIRIGYLATSASPITVTAGGRVARLAVEQGPNSLYLRVNGTFATVRVGGLSPGTQLCVDTVEVGTPVPGGMLS